MKLLGIIELSNERLYFGRTRFFEEKGFRYVISDTPDSTIGFTMETFENGGLREAINLFLSPNGPGSFDQRKKEIQRQADSFEKIKAKFPDFKPSTILNEKYSIH